MTDALERILEARGFQSRGAQERLFSHLTDEDHPEGVIAQAGTGTGKSLAILAAAAHQAEVTGRQSIIVTPTLTLMNQYRDGDTPWAAKAFDHLAFAELRGRSHYWCAFGAGAAELMDEDVVLGCPGSEGGCTHQGWLEAQETDSEYRCDYQAAKTEAMAANVVVTNADMLIVNDRILAPLGVEFFSLDGSLFVDEAHTLEQKLRDYASRSLFWKSLRRFDFAGRAGPVLADWIRDYDDSVALKDTRGFPREALREIANARIPAPRPNDGLTRQRETQEACARIESYLADPHENAVAHVGGGSLRMDWINVAKSSGELLAARHFGLVSATVPKTMAGALGVPEAPFIDVGHPFDYANQAWIGFSAYGGGYGDAKHESNFNQRLGEVRDLLDRSGGGALLLFSSFADLERVHDALRPHLAAKGLTVLRQERDMEPSQRQGLADAFKADGNAVLFGSESFATGFDVPGNALRLVVLWKLPYPAVDPVSNAIRSQSFPRYNDLMKVRAVQAIGRLIRTSEDQGVVWVADNRGRRLLDPTDPLTAHIPEFGRL